MPPATVSTVTVAKPFAKSKVALATSRPSAALSAVVTLSVPDGAAVPDDDDDVVSSPACLLFPQALSSATGAARRAAATIVMCLGMVPRVPGISVIKPAIFGDEAIPAGD